MACSCNSSPCNCDESTLLLPNGPAGVVGDQGSTGLQGPIGLTGSDGDNGAVGPTTCTKLSVDFNVTSSGAAITVVTSTTLANAGMLSNVYYVDANGNVTASSSAAVCDFVWQIWRFDGADYVDAEVEGTITVVTADTSGNIIVISNMAGSYRMVIIG